jgi:hypothetical protein
MDVSFFDHRRVRQTLTVLLLAGSLVCIFPPRAAVFQRWAECAALVATGYLLLGLFFLVINKSRLMFVCLGCSAAISFFKNEMKEKNHPVDFPDPAVRRVEPRPPDADRDSVSLKSVLPDESAKTHR